MWSRSCCRCRVSWSARASCSCSRSEGNRWSAPACWTGTTWSSDARTRPTTATWSPPSSPTTNPRPPSSTSPAGAATSSCSPPTPPSTRSTATRPRSWARSSPSCAASAERLASLTNGLRPGELVRGECAGQGGGGAEVEAGALGEVVDPEDLTLAVGAVDQVAAVVGDQGGQLDLGVGQAAGDGGEQVVDPLTGRGRDHRDPGEQAGQAGAGDLVDQVGLVEDQQLGHVGGADLTEDGADGGHLPGGVGLGGVDQVDDQVGPGDLLQGRLERLDQVMGQLGDEPDGVGEGRGPPTGQVEAPGGGVEGREQLVLDQHPGAGQAVEQGRLAGVGVADQGHGGGAGPLAAAALDVPGPGHVDQVAAELGDAAADAAPVDLHLGLAWAAGADRPGRAHAAADPGQALAPAAQPGQHVVELGQLDLGLALAAGGVLGEDVEDQHGAVDHLGVDQLLQVPQLPGRQLVVHDDGVGPECPDGGGQLLGLALADA